MEDSIVLCLLRHCLLTMAAITILAGNISRIVLIVVLCLLLLYYIGKQRSNFSFSGVSILLFFIVMLNPYVILAAFVLP